MRVALIAIVVLGASIARADPVVDARKHFADLDFELVLADTDRVAADRDAPVSRRTEALYLRASALVVLDREPEAREAFDALLGTDPGYRLPAEAAPRIRAAFEGARAARLVRLEEELSTRNGERLRDVRVDVDEPGSPRGGRTLRLHVHVRDPHRLVARLVFAYRREQDREYIVTAVSAAPDVELAISGDALASSRPYRLAWYLHAVHESGARVRRLGDTDDPRWIAISAGSVPRPEPITKKWWFWAGVTTLVASAITVPILIERSRDIGPQQVVIGR